MYMNKVESFTEDLLLMELNIEAQKREFLTICRASIQREGIEDLLAWLVHVADEAASFLLER